MNLPINSIAPTILTGVAICGVVGTGYAVYKGTLEADRILAMEDNPDGFTEKERFQKTWRYYIPAMVCGSLTIVCIIASRRISAKQIAALTAACGYLAKNRNELEKRIIEEIGEDKLEDIRQKVIGETPWHGESVEDTGKGNILCFESYSGRWFISSEEAVLKAEEQFNNDFWANGNACLNDFYELLGIEKTHFGQLMGWVKDPSYYDQPVDFKNSYIYMNSKDRNVYCIEFWNFPMENWMCI